MAAVPNETTILVADDNVGHLKVLELVLAAYDFEIITAHNGEEAYQFLSDNTPDLIILDINMPCMDVFYTFLFLSITLHWILDQGFPIAQLESFQNVYNRNILE